MFVLLLLAMTDIALLAWLRLRRRRLARAERVIISLQLHLRQNRRDTGSVRARRVSSLV